jgi:hypothetical protein
MYNTWSTTPQFCKYHIYQILAFIKRQLTTNKLKNEQKNSRKHIKA